MVVFNRRLIFWLLKAYLKKWGKAIVFFVLLGFIIFFVLRSSLPYFISLFTGVSKQTIGVVGSYTMSDLPPYITSQISRGLTKIDSSGMPHPDLASSWQVKDNGKIYIFHLLPNVTFDDGTPLNSKNASIPFSDVTTQTPDNLTIIYHLKDVYAPFLITVSRPIFKDNFIGIGPYRIKNVKLNGSFVESLTLVSATKSPTLKVYQFYPTEDALKVGFSLGEVSIAQNLENTKFENTSMQSFPNVAISKITDFSKLVTLFYNTQDSQLSDKRLRDALSYALPNMFSQGDRATSPLPPTSWAYQLTEDRSQDYTHAKLLIEASIGQNKSPSPIIISTLDKYIPVAKTIQANWAKIGVKSSISVVSGPPDSFQVYLADFNVPQDPDQYTLWHSYQENNITHYNSPRIDKLLEDGRKTDDLEQRAKTYADFQKYLLDDQPASFLYFPYEFSVNRK